MALCFSVESWLSMNIGVGEYTVLQSKISYIRSLVGAHPVHLQKLSMSYLFSPQGKWDLYGPAGCPNELNIDQMASIPSWIQGNSRWQDGESAVCSLWCAEQFGGIMKTYTDSKVHGANMGPIWGCRDTGGSHVGPMNFAIWV